MKFNREKRVEQSSVDCHDWIIFFGNKLMEHHCLVRLAKVRNLRMRFIHIMKSRELLIGR